MLGFGTSTPDFSAIRQDLADLMDDDKVVNPSVDEGVQGGGGFVAPMMLRLAWHCSGTWCKTALNGGSDGGTMRFKPECDHGGNAGLGIARDLLEPIKKKYPEISYADLYILAGVVAVEEMAGPKVTFRWGRTDASEPTDPKDDPRFSPGMNIFLKNQNFSGIDSKISKKFPNLKKKILETDYSWLSSLFILSQKQL